MTNEDAVAQGAQLFAEAEAAVTALIVAIPGIINTIRDNGTIGGLEAMQRIADTNSDLNASLGTIASVHGTLTDRAKELEIDVPPPATTKSGARPLGGGGR